MAVPPSPYVPPERPAQLAQGRWLGDLAPLSAAEEALVAACARGETWVPEAWDGKRPTRATAANTIRAEVIRFLLLGGDTGHPVHEEGVMPRGAWITGVLNLHQARCALRLDARSCCFVEEPVLISANLPELVLSGSRAPGLSADRLKVTGGVFLSDGFMAEGEVRLLGVEAGGHLSCGGGSFKMPSGIALSADRIKVIGSVFLSDGVVARGAVRLLGAEIGGDLICSGGSFTVETGDTLNANDLRLSGGLLLHHATISGSIDLTAARIAALVDGDLSVWKSGGHYLDGFRYDRVIGVTDAVERIAWLRQQRSDSLTTKFKPQPWEQLITVLREMGHSYDAGEVAIAKQRQLRAAGKIKGSVRQALHDLYGAFTGYGYRPMRLVYSAVAMWFIASVLYAHAAAIGVMAPSNADIIAHRQLHTDLRGAKADRSACGVRGEAQPANFWPNCPGLPSEYTTFYSFAYSLDLILPLVDLQQERDWAPAVSYTDEHGTVRNSVAGQVIRAVMWFEILFGWTASLVLVAVLTRLVEKD